jgi:cytochrome b561
VKEVHEWLANGLLAVAALHAAAALWHHFVRRDDVLTRMLPGR